MSKRNDDLGLAIFLVAVVTFCWLALKVLISVIKWLWALYKKKAITPARSTGRRVEYSFAGGEFNSANSEFESTVTPNKPLQFWDGKDVEDAIRRDDWDSARAAMQARAYGMLSEDPEIKQKFTELMTWFARQDPLYSEVMRISLPIIAENPGILQTKMYPHLPGMHVEQMRYVFYFAPLIGDIVRIKKGSSYQLFPSGYNVLLISPPAKKTKRTRPQTNTKAL